MPEWQVRSLKFFYVKIVFKFLSDPNFLYVNLFYSENILIKSPKKGKECKIFSFKYFPNMIAGRLNFMEMLLLVVLIRIYYCNYIGKINTDTLNR